MSKPDPLSFGMRITPLGLKGCEEEAAASSSTCEVRRGAAEEARGRARGALISTFGEAQ